MSTAISDAAPLVTEFLLAIPDPAWRRTLTDRWLAAGARRRWDMYLDLCDLHRAPDTQLLFLILHARRGEGEPRPGADAERERELAAWGASGLAEWVEVSPAWRAP